MANFSRLIVVFALFGLGLPSWALDSCTAVVAALNVQGAKIVSDGEASTAWCMNAYPGQTANYCAISGSNSYSIESKTEGGVLYRRIHHTWLGAHSVPSEEFLDWVSCADTPPPDPDPVLDKCSKNAGIDAARGRDFVTDNLTQAGAQAFQQLGITGGNVCFSGCKVALNKSNVVCGGKAGVWTCTAIGGIGAAAHTNCDGSGPSVPTSFGTERPSQMKPGTCPGEVNGVTVYVPCDSTSTKTPTTTTDSSTTNSDGSSSTGSKTDTTSTDCSGGSCTTTTTSTDSDGKSTSTTKTESQDSFCKSNPAAAICKEVTDSKFGGSCSGGFTCDGDAVQCAIAQEQYKRNCTFLEVDNNTSSDYNKAVAGTDGFSTTQMKQDAQQVNVGSFDSTGLGWSRVCPTNPIIPLSFVSGGQLEIPFSRLCGVLGLLAQAGVGCTLLGSLVWVVGSKKS